MSQIEIPDPPGYKVVGYGLPKSGKPYLDNKGNVHVPEADFVHFSYPLLERVAVWRDATIDDLKRAPCKARMRCGPKHEWMHLELGGIKFSYENPKTQWITVGGARYNECQVIDDSNQYPEACIKS